MTRARVRRVIRARRRRMIRARRLLLLLYLALLGASHLVRWQQPEPAPAADQQVQLVEGAPRPRPGPVRIAYREWLPSRASADEGASIDEGASTDPEGASRPSRTPARAPVLLLHGSPGSGASFRRIAPSIAATYRTLAPDLPGFGASSRRVPDYSIRAQAAIVLQMLDSLDVGPVHAVGFSLGGGVALEMHRADPGRLASLTLLSSIGVQEHELLGSYHLNHAVHGLQLFVIVAAAEALPHFGLLDGAFFGRAYARSFYDSDQRPLRGILTSYPGPTLVVHGSRDPLVPAAAAREHHRIVPHSELAMLDGDHFMTFAQPEVVVGPILDFLDRAEAGQATLHASAAPERIRAATAPFNPAATPPVEGFALAMVIVLLIAATFVSEDLTCIGAGLLVAQGSLPWLAGVVACFVGILLGDLMLYAAGRIGRPILRVAPFRWLLRPEELERACRWFEEHSGVLVLTGRFVPGARLPTYTAAGVVRLPFPRFALCALVAAALWTPLLVSAAVLFGAAAQEWLGVFRDQALAWLVATALAALIVLRVLLALATQSGRQRLAGRWCRLRRWEFWPPWLFYLPVAAWVTWLAVRYRSLTVWAAANPGIPPDGGLVGESKSAILFALRRRELGTETLDDAAGETHAAGVAVRVAKTRLVPAGPDAADRLPHRTELDKWVTELDKWVSELGGWPVVVKPDVGERGMGVSVARNPAALAKRLRLARSPVILQEHVSGVELGVFYYRIPGDDRGRIFGITEKRQPTVVGDGSASIARLILADERLRCQFRVFARELGAGTERVPAAGERVVLEERGNHCWGSEFRDGSHLETVALATAVERLSRTLPDFYFGRYDLRGATLDDILAGRFKVIELNGVSAEATHIYDPATSLASAYRTLFRQWSIAFRIGALNRRAGAPTPGAHSVLARLFRHFTSIKAGAGARMAGAGAAQGGRETVGRPALDA